MMHVLVAISWQEQYLTSDYSIVRFFILNRLTDDGVLDDFPKIFDLFPRVS